MWLFLKLFIYFNYNQIIIWHYWAALLIFCIFLFFFYAQMVHKLTNIGSIVNTIFKEKIANRDVLNFSIAISTIKNGILK